MVCSWNILTNTGRNLAKFVFQLFDTSKSGYLRVIEIKELLTIICGDNSNSAKEFSEELAKRNVEEEDDMTFEEFFSYVKESPQLLFSVYEVRDRLRRETLGTARWIDIGIKRSTEFGDRSITDILESLHTKPSCHHLKACRYVRPFHKRIYTVFCFNINLNLRCII